MKKRIACLLTLAMVGSMCTAACAEEPVSFTIFNSKNELQERLETLTAAYGEANNVNIEVYLTSEVIAAHLATKYAAEDPYTLMMVDPKDVYALGADYAIDLSGEEWVDHTDYEITMEDQVKGYPFCIEARGLLYNKTAIENIIGREFVPDEYATLDAFTALLDELVAGGMETPTAVQKDDWSMAAHFFHQVYEQRDNVDEFIDKLYAGEADLINDAKFNAIIDTLDVLLKYNYAKENAATAERELTHIKLHEGEIAFCFDGCWAWGDLKEEDLAGNTLGQMPLPQNLDDGMNKMLVGGSTKYFMIDASEHTSDAQREAAKDFLNWLAMSDEGKSFVTEECDVITAFSNNDLEVKNHYGQCVKSYVDAGAIVPNYDHSPDDHISVVGASLQKYIAGVVDREGLAAEIEAYWSSVTPAAQ